MMLLLAWMTVCCVHTGSSRDGGLGLVQMDRPGTEPN